MTIFVKRRIPKTGIYEYTVYHNAVLIDLYIDEDEYCLELTYDKKEFDKIENVVEIRVK